ncbi:hypothetical protein ADIAL_1861 [Alkalibacterium sp. AK22]|nr:hypothetical protein ADIAL_1861 [Alkalibacterium sp. AK22]
MTLLRQPSEGSGKTIGCLIISRQQMSIYLKTRSGWQAQTLY